MNILGIDPGITGGLALISPEDGVWVEPMPRAGEDIDAKELHRLIRDCMPIHTCYLESIFALPKSGAHSMMRFGRYYGIVLGILAALEIRTIEVRSQEWMKDIYKGVVPPTIKNVKKNRSIYAFYELFPKIDAKTPGRNTLHLGMAEALLIAEFGRRKELACLS